jgi:hypothetical protein
MRAQSSFGLIDAITPVANLPTYPLDRLSRYEDPAIRNWNFSVPFAAFRKTVALPSKMLLAPSAAIGLRVATADHAFGVCSGHIVVETLPGSPKAIPASIARPWREKGSPDIGQISRWLKSKRAGVRFARAPASSHSAISRNCRSPLRLWASFSFGAWSAFQAYIMWTSIKLRGHRCVREVGVAERGAQRAHQVLVALRGPDDMGRDRERTTPPPRALLIIFRELLICFPLPLTFE